MFLNEKAVLKVGDTDTHFPAATFLDAQGETYRQSVHGILLAFVLICCLANTRYSS